MFPLALNVRRQIEQGLRIERFLNGLRVSGDHACFGILYQDGLRSLPYLQGRVYAESLAGDQQKAGCRKRLKSSISNRHLVVRGQGIQKFIVAVSVCRGFAAGVFICVGQTHRCALNHTSGIVFHCSQDGAERGLRYGATSQHQPEQQGCAGGTHTAQNFETKHLNSFLEPQKWVFPEIIKPNVSKG